MATLFSDRGELSRIIALGVKMGRRWNNLMAQVLKELFFGGKQVEQRSGNSSENIYLITNASSTGVWERKHCCRDNGVLRQQPGFFFSFLLLLREEAGDLMKITQLVFGFFFLIMEISLLIEKLGIEEDKEKKFSYFHQPKGPCYCFCGFYFGFFLLF